MAYAVISADFYPTEDPKDPKVEMAMVSKPKPMSHQSLCHFLMCYVGLVTLFLELNKNSAANNPTSAGKLFHYPSPTNPLPVDKYERSKSALKLGC
jgi:hypothetical protein